MPNKIVDKMALIITIFIKNMPKSHLNDKKK